MKEKEDDFNYSAHYYFASLLYYVIQNFQTSNFCFNISKGFFGCNLRTGLKSITI